MIREDDLHACREAIRHGSLSFHAASRLLPARVRDPALALYAFCRLADDEVDLKAEKAAAVLRLEDRLARVYEGRPANAAPDRAFAAVVEEFEMPRALPEALLSALAHLQRCGTPNRLSRDYRHWPELQRVQGLCRAPARPRASWSSAPASVHGDNPGLPLRPILHRRRSAQSMDGRSGIQAGLLLAWLRRLMPAQSPVPFAVTGEPSEVDLLLFVHRVQGLAPGLYWLDRSGSGVQPLREDYLWQRVDDELPLYRLLEGDARGLAGFLSCGQDIAADGCVALAMLARVERAVANGNWRYPRLYWECGLIGQLLYLEAEAAGLSGTGIGCYFDDALRELLGDADNGWQSLYHFTLGRAVWDERLTSLPAYSQPRLADH